MINLKNDFAKLGIKIPEIYLPVSHFEKFAVIAVDQFVENKKYWDEVKEETLTYHTALDLVYPEAYLPLGDASLATINNNMKEYINNKYISSIGEAMVLVERTTSSGIRKGLMLQLDLEQYDFTPSSNSLIRASEKTVVERLPARIKIRKNASLDLPHIMVLVNDKNNILFNSIYKNLNKNNILYNFNLMKNGGNIKGYKICDDISYSNILNAFNELKKEAVNNLLFAVGDGNHSLAAAKECYKNHKGSRYALCEIVNLYDEGLAFFPIHRLLQNVNKDEAIKELNVDMNNLPSLEELQEKLDKYLTTHKEATLEYIHSKDTCIELGKKENNLSFTYDYFDKDTLFETINKKGSLCRKSFSMGEARDKRYYLESCII